MRESNKVFSEKAKSESKTTDTYSENIPQKIQNEINSREVNFKTKLEKDNHPLESKKIENSNPLKRKPVNSRFENDENSNKRTSDNLVYDNEAQFRIIAKKFNEAVEVILELSDKVKNLEETVHILSVNSGKIKKNYSFFNLKTFILIILTTLILLGLFTFPFDLTMVKLIITDVISSIWKLLF